ncbi:hypothetical protein JHK86_047255 [Glycine max]|nr:hypothetical protein JHK86_047255 [Glycine max]
MEGLNSRKRRLVLSDDDDSEKVFTFKILLPNGTSVELTLRDPEAEMPLGNFVRLVKEKYSEARKHCESMKNTRDINWKGGSISLQDANDKKIRNVLNLKNYKPNKYHILRLHDGSSEVAQSFENMWDSTPDTDLLLELPEEYTFETALADLIDNSLQAVWSNGEDKRKLIRVNLGKSKISIFDNGPGLDDTDENSLVKWGKMDASLHRSSKSKAIGGKPPYLMTGGGIRDPLANEIRDSHGSFTKCDDTSDRGKTITPIEFKVNDVDLTEIQGGEVAITNWHSCNGPEFVFQLHLKSEKTDGGFKPTLSKTDLAHHNPFTAALKNFGNKFSEKEKDVTVEIRKATKVLTLLKLQMEYQDWILQMHHQYDEEADSGEDQPVIIVGPANEKALGISSDVIRVHQVLNRKEKSWKRGQKIKVLKGACAGCHRTTIYATIEYFLLEGFEGDAGGEARIICRAIDIPDENGSFLSVGDEDASLEIRGSLSLPISVIDSGKVIAVESIEWENRLTKKQQKSTSIYLPGANHYENLETNGVVSVESIEWENRLYKKQQKSPSINLSGANHYEHLEADGVPVIKMPIVKYAGQPPCTDKGIIDLQEPSLYHENSLIEFFLNYDKELFDSICKLAERIQKVESHLNNSNEKKAETEQEMVKLLEKVEPYQLSIMDSSFTKDELMTKIRSMENSPYSVLCSLSKREKPPNYFLEDLIGVVALIGTVQRPELSRILAEYLGEAKMLGLIYRSFDTASSLEKYNQKGEIDYERALHAEAAALGKAISNRFHVICFEDIRPYTGWLHDDSQRRLALPNPRIANGETPEGFIGYAVNMVDLDINSLQIMTASDFGLRETVLFNLFKKLQVYNTRENMVAARTCIEDGAVSLDGGILSENGILSLGYGNPSICFPCENQKVLPREIEKILPQMEGKKSDLRMIEERIKGLEHSRAKYIKKFNKKKERYDKVTDRMKPMTELLKYKPEAGDGSNSSECSVQYRAVDPNSQNVLSITWIGSPSHPCMVKLNGIRCITIRPENLNLSGIIGADSIFRLQKLKSVLPSLYFMVKKSAKRKSHHNPSSISMDSRTVALGNTDGFEMEVATAIGMLITS